MAADDVDGAGDGVDHGRVLISRSPCRLGRTARPGDTCGPTRATPGRSHRTSTTHAPPAEPLIPPAPAVPPQRPHSAEAYTQSFHTRAHTHGHAHKRVKMLAVGTAKHTRTRMRTHACTDTCAHAQTRTCAPTQMRAQALTQTRMSPTHPHGRCRTPAHARGRARMAPRARAHGRIRRHADTLSHSHTHTHARGPHARTHTRTHTCMRVRVWLQSPVCARARGARVRESVCGYVCVCVLPRTPSNPVVPPQYPLVPPSSLLVPS